MICWWNGIKDSIIVPCTGEGRTYRPSSLGAVWVPFFRYLNSYRSLPGLLLSQRLPKIAASSSVSPQLLWHIHCPIVTKKENTQKWKQLTEAFRGNPLSGPPRLTGRSLLSGQRTSAWYSAFFALFFQKQPRVASSDFSYELFRLPDTHVSTVTSLM